ncbi:regulator of protease activity HflC (stomatin/prohibitin superfamily) [Archangium gephyra]|uniref:Membrane protease subunits, stomatin/prohibitin homologs n=1 Tax=Archangium gephyra TaxID=48 RepID=A0AAC8TIW7_9BACT|nr:SPFH domain-containing protein [Archangium gephyra]AKJ06046.1 Membrane protease subunits, stomatin/prohibitin homologs [Archangium gephyra]REG27201.1 regulator of protease activity HflC (stomatin/prohibitin superfamily) [Archangium gephyra]
MSNETRNEQQRNEQTQETKHPEPKKPGEGLKKLVSLAGEVTRGMVSRGRWLIYAQRGRRVMAGLAVTGLVAGTVAARPLCMIEPGEVGIRVNRLTGNVSELHEGWSLLLPEVHRLSRYSLKDQTYQPARSARATDAAPFQSVEGLSIGVEVNIRYLLDPEKIRALSARLPENVGQEIIEPVIDGVLRRHFAQHTVREIFSTHRVQIQKDLTTELTPLLAADGVILRSVSLGNVDLPHQYRVGMEALLSEELNAEKMRYTLDLKDKQVKQSELEAEADKVRREKAAEAAGNEEIIAAKAKAEAMRHVLPFKEKEIEQRRLEAEAAKVSRLTQATAEAEAHRIEAAGEADARRKLAESDAYRVEVTGKAASEQLARDAELISRNPLLIQKTLADKLSDKIQVIIAPPQAGGFIAGNLLGQPQTAGYAGAPKPSSDPVASTEEMSSQEE